MKTTTDAELTDREKATILYEGGMNPNQIAIQLERPRSTIYDWFGYTRPEDYKIKEWKGKATDEEKNQAVEYYYQLGSIPKVCEAADRSYETIRRWLKDAGVDVSKPYSKPKSHKKLLRLETEVEQLQKENDELRAIISQLAQLKK